MAFAASQRNVRGPFESIPSTSSVGRGIYFIGIGSESVLFASRFPIFDTFDNELSTTVNILSRPTGRRLLS